MSIKVDDFSKNKLSTIGGVREPQSKMVVNFGVPHPIKVDNPNLEEITKVAANFIEKDEKLSIGVEEPRQKLVVNFGVPLSGKVDNPNLEEITKVAANFIEKDEKLSIGVEEPRSKKVDNFDVNLTCLPRTQITLPNPTYRVILIGRRTINYCSSFGREE